MIEQCHNTIININIQCHRSHLPQSFLLNTSLINHTLHHSILSNQISKCSNKTMPINRFIAPYLNLNIEPTWWNRIISKNKLIDQFISKYNSDVIHRFIIFVQLVQTVHFPLFRIFIAPTVYLNWVCDGISAVGYNLVIWS